MKIVQVKGANGSGKTTLALKLLEQSKDVEYLKWDNGTVYATVLWDTGWILIGKYELDKRMGGCDNMRSITEIKLALDEVIENYSGCNVLFEGMMISTIKSTFYDYLLHYEKQPFAHVQPLFIILSAHPDMCIKRISGRGSMKANLNRENIRTKCELVIRHAKEYDQKYVRWLYVDGITADTMFEDFLRLVEA